MTDPIDFAAAEAVAVSAQDSPRWALGFVDAHEHGWMTTDQLSNLARAYLALVKDRERLVAAVKKYGWHLPDPEMCPAYWTLGNGDDAECTCGYRAVTEASRGT